MALVVLDSTVLIDFLRGRPAVTRVLSLRDIGEVPATTAINIEEIARGLRANEQASADRLFSALVVLDIDREVAQVAGSWRREAAKVGVTLAQADCLIAAAAAARGATLATGNPKDFTPRGFALPGVVVDHWPVGE